MSRVAAGVTVIDGLSRSLPVEGPPHAIVSLVPSLTEALFAMGAERAVISRTNYCVEPAGLIERVPTVGGTKNPDVEQIIALRPDLVIASAEENVREHVEALIAAGLRVYISLPNTVRRALAELGDLARLIHREAEAAPWLAEAIALVEALEARRIDQPGVPYFCPIWRRPYMVAAPNTYMSDLLHLCGGANIYGEGPAHYYPVELADVSRRGPEMVLLPSEPYPFAAKHLPEIQSLADTPAVRNGRVHLIDGQWITWYGPRIAPSLRAIAALFEAA